MLKALALATVLIVVPAASFAQTAPAKKAPITKQNTVTKTFTITKIDSATREVTLKAENGDEDTYTVGPAVQRFNQLKVGDKIRATYTEALVFEVRKPDTKGTPTGSTAAGERYKNATGGAVGVAHTVNVTVKAVDMAASTITVATADGKSLTRKIENKKNLEGVHPGDHIDITYSEALIVTADAAK